MGRAKVLWLTGLSGSGKSTIASLFCETILEKGRKAKIIDGDDVRRLKHQHLGFSVEDIKENNRLITDICLEQIHDYDYLIVSVITPFEESRRRSKEKLGEQYVEVYVKASLDTVIHRDPKGLYKKALSGEIENFIGISPNVPYEEPVMPDIVLETEENDIEQCVDALINKVEVKYVA